MNIKFTSLHQIDHNLNQNKTIDINNQSGDLINYTERLINEITNSNNKRSFEFKSDTTEVRTAIDKFLETKYEVGAKINSDRLLNVELKAQQKIAHLNIKIQKGSLFQAVLENALETYIVISKADHNQFLDEIDFTLKTGLPWEKRIFKAFLVKMVSGNPKEIFVYDTTNRMARYWWDDYLELTEKYTDTHNTKTSLKILDSKIFNPIRKAFPSDHTIIRNSAIGYYRNSEEFELNEFIDQTIKNYKPIDSDFPLDKIVSKIKELPDRWKFDARFTIQKDEINKKQSNRIPLTEKIELVLKDYICDLDNVIEAKKDAEGVKYIKIKTDSGYERFKRSK